MIWGSNLSNGKRFLLLQNAQTGYGAHQAYYSIGSRVLSHKVRWPRHEVDDSPPSGA